MKQIFIDSSIFIKMFSFDYDSSPNLKKVLELIESNEIKLVLTDQIINEVQRNREERLGVLLKKLREWKDKTLKIPPFCQEIAPSKAIKKLSEKLYEKLLKQAKEESLEIDKLFKKLISKATILKTDNEVVKDARERYNRGNPPGKKNSYGDCINWVILLKEFPNEKNLYFLTADKDFLSPLDQNIFSLFLTKEWEKTKKSKIIHYDSLSVFLKKEASQSQITEEEIEEEKEAKPIYSSFASGALVVPYGNVVPDVCSSDSTIPQTRLIPDFTGSSTSTEKEMRCEKCGKIFYCKPYEVMPQCPHCSKDRGFFGIMASHF